MGTQKNRLNEPSQWDGFFSPQNMIKPMDKQINTILGIKMLLIWTDANNSIIRTNMVFFKTP